MRLLPVAAALLASLGCGETRGDVGGTGAPDPGATDAAGDGPILGPDAATSGRTDGAAPGSADAGAPVCRAVTLVRDSAEAGPACSFLVPQASEFGVASYDPRLLRVRYEDTAGPRYVLPLQIVRNEADCGTAPGAYYFLPRYAPETVVLCPAACALHFAPEGGTAGGAVVAAYGCPSGDPVL
ncbi:MAG TPA: hypothetical protein VHE30_07615 [Polyangiaceae bacterium]|nr:hypothetical protein [Polyangiaceae bacterium]